MLLSDDLKGERPWKLENDGLLHSKLTVENANYGIYRRATCRQALVVWG
jgi:hypothetical protein